MTTDDMRNLKDLLETMRERDTNFQVSGASIHQYQLGPVLTELVRPSPSSLRLLPPLPQAGRGGSKCLVITAQWRWTNSEIFLCPLAGEGEGA